MPFLVLFRWWGICWGCPSGGGGSVPRSFDYEAGIGGGTSMNRNSNKRNRLASAARLIRQSVKQLWQKMGFWRNEDYPDWMMYLPNPLPQFDEPERKP
jgi:hypothetical protein